MSYQVLARKWRPQTFQDMVGQEHVLQALVHALDNQRLHHAYLFTGTRGVGKTTIGRLLARCLNCETGITPRPCGECTSCREIQEGRFVDLIEIDAASRTGVDDMRELTDNVQYAPSRGRYKVYLIDEVHMLTNQSFNAFLKTLEEPPEHVKFLLATTDPQKLPVTILSRCLQFNLKRMTPEHIAGHLKHVLTAESIPFEEPALWLLARAADGSMRDALSLTDQAIAFGNQKLAASDVSSMLGTIDQRDIERMVDALVANDGPALMAEIRRVSDFAPDYGVILADMLSLFHRVTLEQVVPGSADNALGDAHQVQTLARQLSAEDAQLFYQTALLGRKDLLVTPDARMGFEMTLLRMLAFRPGADRREPPAMSASQHGKPAGQDEPEPAALAPVSAETAEPPPPSIQESQRPPWESSDDPVAASGEPAQEGLPQPQQAGASPTRVPEPVPVPEPENGAAVDQEAFNEQNQPRPVGVADGNASASSQAGAEAPVEYGATTGPEYGVPGDESVSQISEQEPAEFVWARDFRSLDIVGMPGNLASHAAMERKGDDIVLTLDLGHQRLLTERHRERIAEALKRRFGDQVVLQVEVGEPGADTPAAWEERARIARQKAAEASIQNDPLVRSIVERFDGRVVEDSIKPLP
ncbi:DNA polymerase III subunit gamma/tau [Marinobacter sp. SS21]|uniref:DNA polymerase III subunit gamma/tau n=1 Tax=Marinobacter sp. SS21 TaxID=2979460 RepID=UPI0023313323|nr:DNA polymerase III subunit gamma/tau [Marinobacter sp. SS21]MDC0661927.1 DNA polymerase III subunit gamma/tau [Marinobacter sp. SS21]